MNYKKHYDILISRSPKNKPVYGYYECHRIIPGCMNGKYTIDNIVWLTPEEHFVAHQLLYKIYKTNELLYAINMMTIHNTNNRNNNKRYSWLKKHFSEFHPNKTESGRKKLSESMFNYYKSDEYYQISLQRKVKYKEERSCLCGCGEKFEVYKKSVKKYCKSSHAPKNYDKVSKTLSYKLSLLSKEDQTLRIKNSFGQSDNVKRGINISKSKKGIKTQQQDIMGKRYASMSDTDFDNFLLTKKEKSHTRIKKLREKYKNV
jgi:hypothetical protein